MTGHARRIKLSAGDLRQYIAWIEMKKQSVATETSEAEGSDIMNYPTLITLSEAVARALLEKLKSFKPGDEREILLVVEVSTGNPHFEFHPTREIEDHVLYGTESKSDFYRWEKEVLVFVPNEFKISFPNAEGPPIVYKLKPLEHTLARLLCSRDQDTFLSNPEDGLIFKLQHSKEIDFQARCNFKTGEEAEASVALNALDDNTFLENHKRTILNNEHNGVDSILYSVKNHTCSSVGILSKVNHYRNEYEVWFYKQHKNYLSIQKTGQLDQAKKSLIQEVMTTQLVRRLGGYVPKLEVVNVNGFLMSKSAMSKNNRVVPVSNNLPTLVSKLEFKGYAASVVRDILLYKYDSYSSLNMAFVETGDGKTRYVDYDFGTMELWLKDAKAFAGTTDYARNILLLEFILVLWHFPRLSPDRKEEILNVMYSIRRVSPDMIDYLPCMHSVYGMFGYFAELVNTYKDRFRRSRDASLSWLKKGGDFPVDLGLLCNAIYYKVFNDNESMVCNRDNFLKACNKIIEDITSINEEEKEGTAPSEIKSDFEKFCRTELKEVNPKKIHSACDFFRNAILKHNERSFFRRFLTHVMQYKNLQSRHSKSDQDSGKMASIYKLQCNTGLYTIYTGVFYQLTGVMSSNGTEEQEKMVTNFLEFFLKDLVKISNEIYVWVKDNFLLVVSDFAAEYNAFTLASDQKLMENGFTVPGVSAAVAGASFNEQDDAKITTDTSKKLHTTEPPSILGMDKRERLTDTAPPSLLGGSQAVVRQDEAKIQADITAAIKTQGMC